MHKAYAVITFGCQANEADSQRIHAQYSAQGYTKAIDEFHADVVIINTCMVRQMAEERVYGLYHNLIASKEQTGFPKKIIVTGCLVGASAREPSGRVAAKMRRRLPQVDEFLPIEEVGFNNEPLRTSPIHALVPISNGCNNFCTFCIVPFSRGREISRSYQEIIDECQHLAEHGYKEITLIGQNVNSYGADLILGPNNIQVLRDKTVSNFFPQQPDSKKVQTDGYILPNGTKVKPTMVKHLGKVRIPTLFPALLQTLCQINPPFSKIDFISSNPWDFSDQLIKVIANNPQISRQLHLPVQSGSDKILKKMNRWYSASEYLSLINKIKQSIPEIKISTDIIVGFPSESDEDFELTRKLAHTVQFNKAYISRYSPRLGTASEQAFPDDISHQIKKSRWKILEKEINGY